jgi:hypothetical protein
MPAGMSTKVWNSRNWVVRKITFKGAGALNGTLDNTAVVDNGDGTVNIAITGHALLAGSWIYIQGTTNYDGLHRITAIPGVNAITITAVYVAETPAGTEYWGVGLAPGVAWRLNEVRLHLSAAVIAAEAITMTLDSGWGSEFDCQQIGVTLTGLADWDLDPDADLFYEADDVLKFAFANSDGSTWGFEAILVTME